MNHHSFWETRPKFNYLSLFSPAFLHSLNTRRYCSSRHRSPLHTCVWPPNSRPSDASSSQLILKSAFCNGHGQAVIWLLSFLCLRIIEVNVAGRDLWKWVSLTKLSSCGSADAAAQRGRASNRALYVSTSKPPSYVVFGILPLHRCFLVFPTLPFRPVLPNFSGLQVGCSNLPNMWTIMNCDVGL